MEMSDEKEVFGEKLWKLLWITIPAETGLDWEGHDMKVIRTIFSFKLATTCFESPSIKGQQFFLKRLLS